MRRDLEIVDVPVPVRRGPRRWSPRETLYLTSGSFDAPHDPRRRPPHRPHLRPARRRRRDLRPDASRTTRRSAGCRSRSSSATTSAAATSFNHLRTIHGGLRYLQTLDLAPRARVDRRAADAGAHRAARGRAAAVRPAARSLARPRASWRCAPAFVLDRVVAIGPQSRRARRRCGCPAAASCRASDAIRRFPGLRRQGLTGAAVWYDYVTTEADRLTFSWALAAAAHGAVLANHVEATAPLDGRQARGRRARDRRAERTRRSRSARASR